MIVQKCKENDCLEIYKVYDCLEIQIHVYLIGHTGSTFCLCYDRPGSQKLTLVYLSYKYSMTLKDFGLDKKCARKLTKETYSREKVLVHEHFHKTLKEKRAFYRGKR